MITQYMITYTWSIFICVQVFEVEVKLQLENKLRLSNIIVMINTVMNEGKSMSRVLCDFSEWVWDCLSPTWNEVVE